MTAKTSLIAVSCVWAGIATGTYFLGKSSSEPEQIVVEEEQQSRTRRSSRGGGSSEMADSDQRSTAGRALREMRENGAEQTVQRIFAITDPLRRGDELRSLLDAMPAEDFTAFIDAFRESGLARENMGDYKMALFAWAQKDPITALAYAEENTNNPWTRQTLLSAWAQYDVTAAEAWAVGKHDGEGANPWLVGVIEGVVGSDLATATRLINTLPYSEIRGDALGKIMPIVSKLEFDEAVSWLQTIEDERLQAGATRRLADSLGRTDPEKAVAWAETISDPELRTETITEVAEAWVRDDLDAGYAYVSNLPKETQLAMARDFAGDLGRQDFDSAVGWLDSLGSDPRADEAKMGLAWSSMRSDNREKGMEVMRELANSDSTMAEKAKQSIERIERWQAEGGRGRGRDRR